MLRVFYSVGQRGHFHGCDVSSVLTDVLVSELDLAGISHVVTPCTSISEMLKILISFSSFLLSW